MPYLLIILIIAAAVGSHFVSWSYVAAAAFLGLILKIFSGQLRISQLKKIAKRPFLIFFPLIMLIVYPLTGEKDSVILGISYSSVNLDFVLLLIFRLLLILLILQHLKKYIRKEKINKFWEKIGLNEFASIHEESGKILPLMKDELSAEFSVSKKNKLTNPSRVLDSFAMILSRLLKK